MTKVNVSRKVKKYYTAKNKALGALGEIEGLIQPYIEFDIDARDLPGDGILIGVRSEHIEGYDMILMPLGHVVSVINDTGKFTEADIFAI